jgi:hypothetical protein
MEHGTRTWICENYTYVDVDNWDLYGPLQQLGDFPKPRVVEKIRYRILGEIDMVISSRIEWIADLDRLKEIIALLCIFVDKQ